MPAAVPAHARRLAVVLEVLALLALVSGSFPLDAFGPVWWLRLGDSLVNLAPVLLLAVILLRFASFTLNPDDDDAWLALSRQTVQLASLRNRLNGAGSEAEQIGRRQATRPQRRRQQVDGQLLAPDAAKEAPSARRGGGRHSHGG